jgi:alpha-L-fucosidase 2
LKNSLLLKYPASWWGARWREALPSGNGPIGAAVYGAVQDETVLLTHEDLWHGVKTQELPDVSGMLPEVRELLFSGNPRAAECLLADELKRLGYDPNIGSPLPLGDLKIRMPVNKGFGKYRRSLDMETGEVSVCWEDNGVAYSRKLFVSRTEDLVVMEISSSGGPLAVDVTLDLHDQSDARSWITGNATLPQNVERRAEDSGIIRYAARNDAGADFGAVAWVVSSGGELTADSGGVRVVGGERVLVVVKLFVKEDRQLAWARIESELADTAMDYSAFLEPHAAEHGRLFNRVKLDLGGSPRDHRLSNEELLMEAYQGEASAALVEKMWAYGRYLLISSSREGGQPCHLLGNWCGEYRGFWAFNMANENLQMIYWQALAGHLPEATLPVFDYFDRMLGDFRENARKLYGCRGIYVPAVTTPPSGLLKTVMPHIIHWTGAAAWVAQHYYDYFVYTGDERFLRERALPFLRETALFYEDFFTVGGDGFFVSAPSNSPENSPANYWDGKGMGAAMETTINATMDFALAKEVLTHLIEGARLTGEYAGELDKWEGMLARIPPYQINEDGAVKEWMHPFFKDNYHHRHQSHIYPVFPGNEVTRESDPALFHAFEIAIRKRLVIGLGEQTGWSLAHMAGVYARMQDGDRALECLDLLSRSCVMNNFFTTHNDWRQMGVGLKMEWAPFQIDANMGWSAAVQQMLMSSTPGRILILPALPARWRAGSVKGLVACGGVEVSISWDAATVEVGLLSAGKDQVVKIVPPFGAGNNVAVELLADQPRTLSFSRKPAGTPGVLALA